MNARRYRRFVIGSVASLIALVMIVWILNPRGEGGTLPAPLESVFPLPGDTVVLQTAIEVDLPVGYTLELEVDGIAIPQIEMGHTPATGRFVWQPGPTTLFDTWEGGEHTVVIRWDRISGGGPDPGDFSWVFRVV